MYSGEELFAITRNIFSRSRYIPLIKISYYLLGLNIDLIMEAYAKASLKLVERIEQIFLQK